jgi:hypothetical protein
MLASAYDDMMIADVCEKIEQSAAPASAPNKRDFT